MGRFSHHTVRSMCPTCVQCVMRSADLCQHTLTSLICHFFLAAGRRYTIGSYLGGGAAGTVYECTASDGKRHAVKIINPVAYKILPPAAMAQCSIAVKGLPRTSPSVPLLQSNLWWFQDPSSRGNLLAAYEGPGGSLRELSLPLCVQLWGVDPPELSLSGVVDCVSTTLPQDQLPALPVTVTIRGRTIPVPRIPAKYVAFLRARAAIYREITAMAALGRHDNVLSLHAVLEQVSDAKCTLFLVLEYAAGGELFDRIKPDAGVAEDTAAYYAAQLLAGVAYCHEHGVVHRCVCLSTCLVLPRPFVAVALQYNVALLSRISNPAAILSQRTCCFQKNACRVSTTRARRRHPVVVKHATFLR